MQILKLKNKFKKEENLLLSILMKGMNMKKMILKIISLIQKLIIEIQELMRTQSQNQCQIVILNHQEPLKKIKKILIKKDIKLGKAAFMKNQEEAEKLAKYMV